MSDILSVQKGLLILDEVAASSPQSIGTRELARRLGINLTSVHNIATTLASRGFLRKTVKPRGWKLGYHLLNLTASEKFENVFRDIVSPIVDEFFKELQETVMLTSIYKSSMFKLICIKAEHHMLKAEEPEHMERYAYCTACGKIMLAGLDEPLLNRYFQENKLEKYTEKTIVSTAEMVGEIIRIKKEGYGETRDELRDGISALAVPIKENSGQTIAALGTSVPTVRFTWQWRKNAITQLKQFAKTIELKLENS